MRKPITALVLFVFSLLLGAYGAPPGNPGDSNANSNAKSNANSSAVPSKPVQGQVDTREPEKYKGTVTIHFESIGEAARLSSPTLSANIARNGEDRRMEFTMPAGGKVVYLDKGNNHYLILPDKKQYAKIDQQSTGFEIRRMMMPEQMVQQIKNTPGIEEIAGTRANGRDAVMYRYTNTTKTQTQAGDVQTVATLSVDKQTGLPLHSETEVKAAAAIQGYSGLRVITDITDVDTNVSPDLFQEPTNLQAIPADQVREQVDAVFNTIAGVMADLLKQSLNPGSSSSQAASPTPSQ